MKERIEGRVNKYTQQDNKVKLRMYLREKWAIVGMMEKGLEFQTLLKLHEKFKELDLLPTHYDYPEFYRF